MKEDIFLEVARSLPENATLEDIIDEVYIRLSILKGLEDVEKGNLYTLEEAKERLKNAIASNWVCFARFRVFCKVYQKDWTI